MIHLAKIEHTQLEINIFSFGSYRECVYGENLGFVAQGELTNV